MADSGKERDTIDITGHDNFAYSAPPGGGGKQRITQDMILANAKQLRIDWDHIPRVPFWGPWFGFTEAWYRTEVAGRVMAASVLLARELQDEEKQTLAYITAKRCVYRAWEPPFWIATTFWYERRGRATFRFPFYTPNPASFNPDVFPSERIPFLTGPPARTMWHCGRVGAYAAMSHLVLAGLFRSYADLTWQASIFADKRLVAIKDAVIAAAAAGGRTNRGGPSRPPAGIPHGEGEEEDSQEGHRDQMERDTSAPYFGQMVQSAVAEEERMQGPEKRLAALERQRQELLRRRQEEEEERDDNDFLFDDASPVAPSARQPQGSSGSRGGSAWDRLRQRAAGQGSSSNQGSGVQQTGWAGRGQKTQQSRSSDSYVYSTAEEDRALAKAQAQREFDEMLERERRGVGDSGRR
ncbi:hypothetical protein QBC46DRAFT_391552 [Diplogelasinospora grovesii]|uniref:Uncharacterized protein n=1 Tax=Diplogelasinospora grovesii TaxID=303347 RepID=A0AAN6N3T5_9PEZI|nr:hypothetical protein QBC46DRAFT_391552 [Diplogelasinospora grovesii]